GRSVWLKAVARAWRSDKFERDLIADPHTALAQAFGYSVPRGLSIKVVKVTDTTRYGWELPGQPGWSLPLPELTVFLPPKPAVPEDQAVAISDLLGTDTSCCADTCCF